MGMWAYFTGAPGASGYGSATTAEEVATAYDAQLRGKVAIVTGAAGGIGLETARVFANHGATVYVSARSASKCDEAIAAIRAATPVGGAELKLKPFVADLGSFKTIKAAVDAFLADNVPLHILVCNAGTSDGRERRRETRKKTRNAEEDAGRGRRRGTRAGRGRDEARKRDEAGTRPGPRN